MNSRQKDIIELLSVRGEVAIKEIAEICGVAQMTVHRDLDFLEKEGFIYKKRGAAVFVDSEDRNKGLYEEEKRAIGRKAASLIKSGQSVLIDNSTTALACVRFLADLEGVTYYTTNIEAAEIISKYKNCVLYCSGGYYFPDSKGFVGSMAEAFVASLNVDVCIIGASGISLHKGITNPYPMHSVLQRKIVEASKKRILLADHSKFNKAAVEKAADISEIDVIVTDSGIKPETVRKYSEYTEIIIA